MRFSAKSRIGVIVLKMPSVYDYIKETVGVISILIILQGKVLDFFKMQKKSISS